MLRGSFAVDNWDIKAIYCAKCYLDQGSHHVEGLRDDHDDRKDPQEEAKEQQLEGDEVVRPHASSNQLEVHNLLVDAHLAFRAVLSPLGLEHFPAAAHAALAGVACAGGLNGGDAGVDECGGQPHHVQVYEDDQRDEIEGLEALLAAQPEDQDEGGDVDQQKGAQEEQVWIAAVVQFGPRVSSGSPSE